MEVCVLEMYSKPWEKMGKDSGFGHGAEMKRLRDFWMVTAEAFGPPRGEEMCLWVFQEVGRVSEGVLRNPGDPKV